PPLHAASRPIRAAAGAASMKREIPGTGPPGVAVARWRAGGARTALFRPVLPRTGDSDHKLLVACAAPAAPPRETPSRPADCPTGWTRHCHVRWTPPGGGGAGIGAG